MTVLSNSGHCFVLLKKNNGLFWCDDCPTSFHCDFFITTSFQNLPGRNLTKFPHKKNETHLSKHLWFQKGWDPFKQKKSTSLPFLAAIATSPSVARWLSGTPRLLTNENFVVRRSRWHFGLPYWASWLPRLLACWFFFRGGKWEAKDYLFKVNMLYWG